MARNFIYFCVRDKNMSYIIKTALLLAFLLLQVPQSKAQFNNDSTDVIIFGPHTCFYTNKLKYELKLLKIPHIYKDVKDLDCLEEMWEVMEKRHYEEHTTNYPLVLIKGKIYIRPSYAKVKRKLR